MDQNIEGRCSGGTSVSDSIDLADRTGRGKKLSESGREICIHDLVWCKIRGRFWWPGKLIGRSVGKTNSSKEYFVVSCFGDKAFGLTRVSQIRPLCEHFQAMENQSRLGNLRNAVDCALAEVSRRLEYVLTCDCMPKELDARIETEAAVATSIEEDSSGRRDGDGVLSAASFVSEELVKYVKLLGISPLSDADRLVRTVVKTQLLTYHRWKGFSQLPKFTILSGLYQNEGATILLENCDQGPRLMNDSSLESRGPHEMLEEQGNMVCPASDLNKRKCIYKHNVYPRKKRKIFLTPLEDKQLHTSTTEIGSERNVCGNSISFDKAGGLTEAELISRCSGSIPMMGVGQSLRSKQTHRKCIGIREDARKSNGFILSEDHCDGSLVRRGKTTNSKSDYILHKSLRRMKCVARSSPALMLSCLYLASSDPMGKQDFLSSTVSFFSEFRNSVVMDRLKVKEHGHFAEQCETQGTLMNLKISGAVEFRYSENSYRTDKMVKCIPEQQQSRDTLYSLFKTPCGNSVPPMKPLVADESGPTLIRALDISLKNVDMGASKTNDDVCGSFKHSVLKTVCGEPVPSVEPQISQEIHPNMIGESEVSGGNRVRVVEKPVVLGVSGGSQESFRDGRILQSIPELQLSWKNQYASDSPIKTPGKEFVPSMDSDMAQELRSSLIQEPEVSFETPYMEAKPVDGVSGTSGEDNFPTALILTFTDLNHIPSLANLNRIFSCFGPLNEPESKLYKQSKRAQLVFMSRSHAETAFFCLGERRIFGPHLRSYRLKYVQSMTNKAAHHARRGTKNSAAL